MANEVTYTERVSELAQRSNVRLRAELRSYQLRQVLDVRPRDDLIVIGDLVYGGYRVPADSLHQGSVVYSIGVGEDIRFDLSLIARFGCTVHALDPVPQAAAYAEAAAAHEPRFVFHQLALWSRDEVVTFHEPRESGYVSHSAVNLFDTAVAFQAEGRSLRSLMGSLGQDHVDLLKVSSEGSEFEILDTLLRDGPVVPILCAEFLLPPVAEATDMLRRLTTAGYELVSSYVTAAQWTFTWLSGDR